MTTSRRRADGEGSNPRQRADGRWQVHIRYATPDGLSKRTTVYGKTAAETTTKAAEVRTRLRAELPARDARVALSAYVTGWLDSTLAASDRKASTKSLYATLARKHIVGSKMAALTLDRVKASHVEAWTVELARKGLSPSTVRSTYTVLRAVLDTAVRDGDLARNPAALVRRPKVTTAEAAYLTPGQVRTLLAAANGRYVPVFELLLNTGLRRGEALALRWSDVDLEKHVLRVRGTLARVDGHLVVTEPKTARSRRSIHLSAACESILKTAKKSQTEERLRAGSQWVQTGFVFTTEDGQPRDPRNALRALKVAADRAGLPGVGLHTLRHSAASTMLSAGVPLKVVSEILGHSSIAITGDVYGHVAPDVAAAAIDGLSTAWEA